MFFFLSFLLIKCLRVKFGFIFSFLFYCYICLNKLCTWLVKIKAQDTLFVSWAFYVYFFLVFIWYLNTNIRDEWWTGLEMEICLKSWVCFFNIYTCIYLSFLLLIVFTHAGKKRKNKGLVHAMLQQWPSQPSWDWWGIICNTQACISIFGNVRGGMSVNLNLYL